MAAFVFLVLAVGNQRHMKSTKVSCKNTMPKADGSSDGFTQETLEKRIFHQCSKCLWDWTDLPAASDFG